jgi:hypothetical protein
MPSPLRIRHNMSRFFGWTRKTLDDLCERPDHLQRLSIIGSGFIMWPTMIGFALIVPTNIIMGLYVHSGYEMLPRWWNRSWATKWFISATFHVPSSRA